jgi:HlyD family secretion protein
MSSGSRRVAVIGAIVVVVGAGAGAAYAAMSSSGPAYRLAPVTSAEVTAILNEVGTLAPAQQADVAFPVSGTVATVAVRAGHQVTAGQTLGTLDTSALQASLTAAQSTLANAKLTVSSDLASQDAATAGSTTSAVSPSTPGSPSASALPPLQQAVLTSQHQVDAALALAKTALAQASQVCAPSPPSPSAGRTTQPGTKAPPSAAPPPACPAATQQVLADETAALHDQEALSGQLSALSSALTQAISAAGASAAGSGGAPGDGSTAGTPGSDSPGGGSSPGSSPNSGGPVSAAQLAADQASADAAAAQVTVAQQNVAEATLVSPLSGTVISVTAQAGAAESGGSTAFEVAGLDSWQVQTQVPVSDMPQLATGQPASALPDGSSVPLSGAVVTIGLMPAPDSNPVTYPVTIGLAGQPSGLHAGGYGAVTITTARTGGVSVPTSAVHYSGDHATVTVYTAGSTRVTRVKVGTKGPVMTRITSGLAIGQRVVLANLNAPLPSNNPSGGFNGPVPGGTRIQINVSGR